MRYANILEGGSVHVKNIVTHRGAAQKLAFEPGNPHVFYSCGEDAFVYRVSFSLIFSTLMFIFHSN